MNDMVDMSKFVEAKSDQLNADDLIGAPRTITVRKVTGNDGDQPVSIFYEGDNNKPFKPCKTMRRVLLAVWGRNAADYVGRSMRIYRDDNVQFGGLNVGGIRISHMSNISEKTIVVVMKTKGKKAGIEVMPLAMQQADDPAARWAAGYIRNVNAATDRDALVAFAETKASKMEELYGARPDLHQKCADAFHARLDALAPQEGRADPDMGEGFADDAGDAE